MLDRRWRGGVERGLGPVGDRLRRLGVSPDALTVFGLIASAGAAVLIGSGHHGWAVVAVIVYFVLRSVFGGRAGRRDSIAR